MKRDEELKLRVVPREDDRNDDGGRGRSLRRSASRRTQDRLRHASTKLRTEFTQTLQTGLQTLKDSNAAQAKALEADLKIQSDFQFHYVRALAGYIAGQYAESRRLLRRALAIYKSGKPKQLIEKQYGALAAVNIFLAFWDEDAPNHVKNATNELAEELYDGLEEELALAAVSIAWLGPLLKERKPTPSQPTPAESKTEQAKPKAQPAPPPKDAK